MELQTSIDLFFIAILILIVILMVLLILCWTFKKSKNRDLTELRISARHPPLKLVIRTKPDHAQQLMDHLLTRVFLRLDGGPDTEGEPAGEQGAETEPGPTTSPAANHPDKTLNTFYKKMTQWITAAVPKKERKINYKVESPHPPPADEDEADQLPPQRADESQRASSSCQGASSQCCEEDKQHDETNTSLNKEK